eukprot:scaffold912_cov121-Skeletonema_dohrnii-CCMP3373.AAC.15
MPSIVRCSLLRFYEQLHGCMLNDQRLRERLFFTTSSLASRDRSNKSCHQKGICPACPIITGGRSRSRSADGFLRRSSEWRCLGCGPLRVQTSSRQVESSNKPGDNARVIRILDDTPHHVRSRDGAALQSLFFVKRLSYNESPQVIIDNQRVVPNALNQEVYVQQKRRQLV